MRGLLFVSLQTTVPLLRSTLLKRSKATLDPLKKSMSHAPRRSSRLSIKALSASPDSPKIPIDQSTKKRAQTCPDDEQNDPSTIEIQSATETPPSSKPKTTGSRDRKRPRKAKKESASTVAQVVISANSSAEKASRAVITEPSNSAPIPLPIYPPDHASKPYIIPPGILRVVTWNVASFRSILKSGAFQSYLDKENPHILCLQETKLSEGAMGGIPTFKGYDVHWNHSTAKKGYSGVAVFINSNISSLNLVLEKVEQGMGDEIADAEGRVLSLFFNNRLAIINSYVPNSGGKLARLDYRTTGFEPVMRNFLNETAKSWNVLYCGDLNVAHEEIDIHDSKGNKKSAGHTPEERNEFGELLESGAGWIDCWRTLYKEYPGYTYYSRRFGTRLKEAGKGWRLDYHLIDSKSFKLGVLSDCFVRPDIEGSDHYPLIVDYRISENLH